MVEGKYVVMKVSKTRDIPAMYGHSSLISLADSVALL